MSSSTISVLCDACAQLGILIQGAEPHSALLDRGSRPPSDDNSVDQLFRCADCNTIWIRHVDKWGIEGMFRLASNSPAPEKHN